MRPHCYSFDASSSFFTFSDIGGSSTSTMLTGVLRNRIRIRLLQCSTVSFSTAGQQKNHYDIVIVGGGMVGGTMASALGKHSLYLPRILTYILQSQVTRKFSQTNRSSCSKALPNSRDSQRMVNTVTACRPSMGAPGGCWTASECGRKSFQFGRIPSTKCKSGMHPPTRLSASRRTKNPSHTS